MKNIFYINLFLIPLFLTSIVSPMLSQQEDDLMQYDEHSIQILDKLSLSYYKTGQSARNLILIHGLGSNKKAWLKLMPLLEKEFTVYAIDLPKYLSTNEADKISMDHFSHCVRLFIEKLKIDKPFLMGHSMGGQVSMHVALKHPQLLSGLVLIAPAGIETFSEKDKSWFNTYLTKDFLLSQSEAQIKYSFDINFYGSSLPADALFMLEDRYNIQKDSIKYGRYIDYTLASIQAMLNAPVFDQLPNLNIPTLVCYGDSDLLIPNRMLHPTLNLESLRETVQSIPHSEFYSISKSGHFIQWDNPDELAKLITQFITEL